jgi:Mor family transcriptional regulator
MPHAKLDEDKVRAIRAAHPAMSMARLAKVYGVSESTINNVINRRKWAWVA